MDLGVLCTYPFSGIEAIIGFLPINLHLQKLNNKFHLRAYTLPANHIIKSLLETRLMNDIKAY